ncbi:MAG: exodeoxyribonuclease VII small subunit [Lachnospiraceae bacterium]|nr:exodeoxyribonuclease VII small subunit [Candidatus Fimimorpha excrementavium]
MTIDETLEQLNAIIQDMETKSQSLEESLASFEKGIQLIKSCSKQIDKVEKKIKILSESGEESDMEGRTGSENVAD